MSAIRARVAIVEAHNASMRALLTNTARDWKRATAELADADATISDLLDQCARLRGALRCQVNETMRFQGERDNWERFDKIHLARAEKAERERDEARLDADALRRSVDGCKDALRHVATQCFAARTHALRWKRAASVFRARLRNTRDHSLTLALVAQGRELAETRAERDAALAKLARWGQAERVSRPCECASLGGRGVLECSCPDIEWARVPSEGDG
jgi:hypothetical protein